MSRAGPILLFILLLLLIFFLILIFLLIFLCASSLGTLRAFLGSEPDLETNIEPLGPEVAQNNRRHGRQGAAAGEEGGSRDAAGIDDAVEVIAGPRCGMLRRAGAPRDQALRNLAMRTGVESVEGFVTMIIQAGRFGTSIAQSLRVHSDAVRTQRRQRAEETAAKVPLKLLFPLIFCIFPALMLVIMGPAVIQMIRVVMPR